jgi:alkanesulfonate monooxygenase SsuD/methylene tetrahydromethanopterin reductase-like flavin-dependent oxidoreductase (luciferase family)
VAIAGTAKRVREEIEREIAASGCSYFVCQLVFGNMTDAEATASVERFVEEVMPRIAALGAPR